MPERWWTINGRFLCQKVTGVQRYAREVVVQLDRLVADRHPLAQELSLDIVVPAGASDLPGLRAIPIRRVPVLSGHLWEQITLARQARGGILSLGNTSTVLRERQVVCMHDLNTFSRPESYSLAFRLLYRGLLPVLGRRSRRVVTVSRYSADQLIRTGVARADKLLIAPNGHEHVLRWGRPSPGAPAAVLRRDTVAVLGSLAPHKNLATLLKIGPDLRRAGLKLAVIGDVDRHVFGSSAPVSADPAIEWLGPLSDAALAELLPNCLCLAFPSLAEGFGLPPLEAMVLGCPVVVSDRTSIPEVCGDAALYAPAEDGPAWLECFLRLRDDPCLRSEMIRRGQVRVARFSWRRSAEVFLAAMAAADGLVSREPVTREEECLA